MKMEIGNPRLRYRRQSLLLDLFAEIARHQLLDDLALDVLGEALANNASRHLAFAEPRDARNLGVTGDQLLGLRLHHIGGDFNGQLALAGVRNFSGSGFWFDRNRSFGSSARFRGVVFSRARFACQ